MFYRATRNPLTKEETKEFSRALPVYLKECWKTLRSRDPEASRLWLAGFAFTTIYVGDDVSNLAAFQLRFEDFGSPLWRFLVLLASGKVHGRDLWVLAEVLEALNGTRSVWSAMAPFLKTAGQRSAYLHAQLLVAETAEKKGENLLPHAVRLGQVATTMLVCGDKMGKFRKDPVEHWVSYFSVIAILDYQKRRGTA